MKEQRRNTKDTGFAESELGYLDQGVSTLLQEGRLLIYVLL